MWRDALERVTFLSWLLRVRLYRVLWPIDVYNRWSDTTAYLQLQLPAGFTEASLDLFQITDSHISQGPLTLEDGPFAERMHNAFATHSARTNRTEVQPISVFRELVDLAAASRAGIVALSGDILSFPQARTADWVVQTLNGSLRQPRSGERIPYVYCAGNHDWFPEGLDAGQRELQLEWRRKALHPLYDRSATGLGPSADQYDFGSSVVGGLLLLTIDNSRYQITGEQLAFFRGQLLRWLPTILILHVPLSVRDNLRPFAGFTLCGDPAWGEDTDNAWTHERRARWPRSGNSQTTTLFLEAVLAAAAPRGPLVAVLAGHVHAHDETPFGDDTESDEAAAAVMGSNPLVHSRNQWAWGAVQYIGLPSFNGGYRALSISTWAAAGAQRSEETVSFRKDAAERGSLARAASHVLAGLSYMAWDVPPPTALAPLRSLAWKCWGGIRGEAATAALVNVSLLAEAFDIMLQRTVAAVGAGFDVLARALQPLGSARSYGDADERCVAEVGGLLQAALPLWAHPEVIIYEPGRHLELVPGCSILEPLNRAVNAWLHGPDWLKLGASLAQVMDSTVCNASSAAYPK